MGARHAIHAVGPVWRGIGRGEAALPAGAHRASLALLREAGGASAAFPAISTGIHGHPAAQARRIAASTRREHGAGRDTAFARFDAATLAPYEKEPAAP